MIYPFIEKNLTRHGDKVLLQIKRNEEYVRYTYAEVVRKARNLACRLQEMGAKGSYVALWGDSTPEWCIAYLGIHLSGAIVIPMDIQYPELAVANLIKFTDCRIVVCAESVLDKVKSIGRDIPLEWFTLEPDASQSILSIPEEKEGFQVHLAQPEDVMSLIFTSGTTDEPKGVMLTCQNFISNAKSFLDLGWVNYEKENILGLLPLHHCYAFTTTCMLPLVGACQATFQPVLKGPEIVATAQETGVTIMPVVPKLITLFYQAIFENVEKQSFFKRFLFGIFYKISKWGRICFGLRLGTLFFKAIHKKFGPRFKMFVSGGAKLEPEVSEKMWNLGFRVLEGYGLTETAPVISSSPPSGFYRGSVGAPLPGVEVKIFQPDAQGVGEIIMRGPNLMKGYYKREEATAEAIRDGWFHTGDLGFLDKRNHLHITGRAKEIIVLGSGKNIYPEEVEKQYEKSPLIAELCVMGEKKGDGCTESLTAVVVPDFEEIKRRKLNSIYMEIKFEITNLGIPLPSYMRLNSFRIVTEPLPRTRLGKLKRNLIGKSHFEDYQEEKAEPGELSEEDRHLLSKPSSEQFLQRLQTLAGYEKEIFPSDSLEIDLGLDSLKQMELLVVLDQQFGVKVPPDTFLSHVKDILALLPETSSGVAGQRFSWGNLLNQKRKPSLDEMFNLNRGFLGMFFVDLIRIFLKLFFRMCFALKISGVSEIEKHDGPVVISPNHQSYLDALFIFATLPRKRLHKTMFIAFDAYFKKGILSLLVRPGRIIKTASARTNISSLQYAAEALEKGFSVCIFPEGQRSPNGKLEKTLIGPAILSCERKVPIFPLVINGAMATFSRTHKGFHFANVSLELLPPLRLPEKGEYDENDYQELMKIWASRVGEKIVEPMERNETK